MHPCRRLAQSQAGTGRADDGRGARSCGRTDLGPRRVVTGGAVTQQLDSGADRSRHHCRPIRLVDVQTPAWCESGARSPDRDPSVQDTGREKWNAAHGGGP